MRYIIDFIDSMSTADIETYCAGAGITIVRQYTTFGNVYLCESDSEPTTNAQIESVVVDSDNPILLLGLDVTLTETSTANTVDTTNDVNWWKMASLNTVDYEQTSINVPRRGYGTKAYVMDSGVNADHPEFSNTTVTNLYSVLGNDYSDRNGHGTAIASVISGTFCGLTAAEIKNVKIFDPTHDTLQSELLAALDAIAIDHVNSGGSAGVVNMSWGIAKNDYINAKIQYLINNLGMYVVAAAGNAGLPIGDITPASIPEVLTIGSYGRELTPSNFSNYTGGSNISYTANETNYGALDGWAPGEYIWAAKKDGGYDHVAGTSIACAIAAGACCYNFSKYVDDNGMGLEFFTNFATKSAEIAGTYTPQRTEPVWKATMPFNQFVTARMNLLDLSDPKYANSTNQLVTYTGGIQQQATQPTIHIAENTTRYWPLVNPFDVARIYTNDDVPSWITLDNKGVLTINAPAFDTVEDTLAINSPTFKTIAPIEFTYIGRDGTESTLIMTLRVAHNTVNMNDIRSSVADDDPILNITLFACTGFGCSPSCWQAGCAYINKTYGCWCEG